MKFLIFKLKYSKDRVQTQNTNFGTIIKYHWFLNFHITDGINLRVEYNIHL